MELNLDKNAVLCLEEALIKYQASKKNKLQYPFAIKELSDCIELYLKFILTKQAISLTNLPNFRRSYLKIISIDYSSGLKDKNLTELNFRDLIDIYFTEDTQLLAHLNRFRELRNSLTHYKCTVSDYEFNLFHIIITDFDTALKNNYNRFLLEESCSKYNKIDTYNKIIKIQCSYETQLYQAIENKGTDYIVNNYNPIILLEIFLNQNNPYNKEDHYIPYLVAELEQRKLFTYENKKNIFDNANYEYADYIVNNYDPIILLEIFLNKNNPYNEEDKGIPYLVAELEQRKLFTYENKKNIFDNSNHYYLNDEFAFEFECPECANIDSFYTLEEMVNVCNKDTLIEFQCAEKTPYCIECKQTLDAINDNQRDDFDGTCPRCGIIVNQNNNMCNSCDSCQEKIDSE